MQPVACRACDGTAGYAEVAAATPGEPIDPLETERLYKREIDRLRLSIKAMEEIAGPSDDCVRIAVTHFPPCDASLTPNSVTGLLECHGISHVVFGHLHNVRQDLDPAPFGERVGIRYHLTTCDYLNFKPVAIGTTD